MCIKDVRGKSELFIKHMTPILTHLRSKSVTPIMWDDMMRHWTVDQLKGVSGNLLITFAVGIVHLNKTPGGVYARRVGVHIKLFIRSDNHSLFAPRNKIVAGRLLLAFKSFNEGSVKFCTGK